MTGLLVGLVCFTLHAAVTLLWLRVPGRASPVGRHAISALGTHVLGVVVAGWVVGPFAYWPTVSVSAFCAIAWLFAYSAVYKSVSLRVLAELERSPARSLALETITEEYIRPEFGARIAVLEKMGCAEEMEDGFGPTRRGTQVARRLALVQWVFGIDSVGMYWESAHPDREETGETLSRGRGSPAITPPTRG